MMKSLTYQPRRVIARRLIFSVIAFSATITLFITSIQLYHDYLHDISLINSRMQQIEHVNLRTLTNSLWVADTSELNIHLSGILSLPDMQYLEIRNGNKLWASAGTDQHSNVIARSFPMIREYRGKPEKIGTLKVVASLNGVYTRLTNEVIVILISNGIKTFLVAGFILFIFRRLVTRHLVKIAEYASSRDMEHLGSQLQLDRKKNMEYEHDELGTVVSALNTMQNNLNHSFTALQNSERELRQHREHLEELVEKRTAELKQQAMIIDQIHDAVVSTDMEGYVISWNKGAERLFDYTAEEALGKHISFLHPEDEVDRLQIDIIEPLQRKGEHEIELKLIRKGGETFFAHLALSLLHDKYGTVKGMIGYTMDVSARKQAELKAHRKALELQAANKELEAFAYSVSHDLRAPLRSISGFSSVIVEDYADRLDESAIDYLKRIQSGTMRMSHIIDDLLKLSRLTRVELNPQNINLTKLVNDIMTQLQQQEPERIVDVKIANNIRANGDIGLLKVALENLLSNAWKYTAKKDRAVIEFGSYGKDREKVFFVKDNGAGFDMRYATKLFGVFQRMHAEREFPGIGIGLATVQRIIKRHGGKIWAEAEPHKGAIFYFTLNDAIISDL